MSFGNSNLLDEALDPSHPSSGLNHLMLVKDCAETGGGFILHHLLKKTLSPASLQGAVVLVALAHPFSHYDRILRKLGCNLSAHRDAGRLHFIDMLRLEIKGSTAETGFIDLFERIQNAVAAACSIGRTRIIIDDISLLDIAAYGSTNHVMDLLHYCISLTSGMDCSIVVLDHADVYSDMDTPTLISHVEYLADIIIKAQPLVTGLAADVHGQLTVIDKRNSQALKKSGNKVRNFHFRVQENGADFFYPGKYY